MDYQTKRNYYRIWNHYYVRIKIKSYRSAHVTKVRPNSLIGKTDGVSELEFNENYWCMANVETYLDSPECSKDEFMMALKEVKKKISLR